MLKNTNNFPQLTPVINTCFSLSVWLETLGVHAFTHLKSWKAWWSDRAFIPLKSDDSDFSRNIDKK